MKSDTHPQWHPKGTVNCACGSVITVGMVKPNIKVEICAKCHPFFTGEMRFLDSMGRVEKFQNMQKFAETQSVKLADKKKKRKEKEEARANAPKSLKEMLIGMK